MTDATAYLLRPIVIAIAISIVLLIGTCVGRDIIQAVNTTTHATNYTIFTNIKISYSNAGESNDDYLWQKRNTSAPNLFGNSTTIKK